MTRHAITRVAVAVLALACSGWAAPAGAAAPATTTTLVLSATTSTYGQAVRASAAVASTNGPAEGDVLFTVDGAEIKANLTGGGTASILLPDVEVGTHSVVATFVPQVPGRQESSASPVQTWQVERARVDLGLRVSGARRTSVARVHVDARGDFATVPEGAVRLRLFRGDPPPRKVRTAVLDAAGLAVSRLGRLTSGRYRVVVVYAGDARHLRATRTVRFRVP